MAKKQIIKQDAEMWAKTGAGLGFATWILTIAWHGFMGQPSMMGMLYPGWMWLSPMTSIVSLVGFVAVGALYGYLFATIWNWFAEKK